MRIMKGSQHECRFYNPVSYTHLDVYKRQEPDNPYDPFAVKVVIDDVIVGHLDAARARQWSEDLFAASGIRGIAAYARIVGGFERADGTLAMLGVRLDIAFPVMAVGCLLYTSRCV